MTDAVINEQRPEAATELPEEQSQRELGRAERLVAIALIAVFILALAIMFAVRDDRNWDRLVFLFGGLEALVFAGAGALFGTSVQRSNVADAKRDAATARATADAARGEAQAKTAEAEKGRALAEAIRAAGTAGQGPSPDRPAAREGDVPLGGRGTDLDTLQRLADRLFPSA